MPKSRAHMRSSRRVPPLLDSEIDHEINLVNHAASPDHAQRSSAATADTSPILSTSEQPLSPTDSQAPLTKSTPDGQNSRPSGDAAADEQPADEQDVSIPTINEPEPEATDNTQRDSLAKPRSNGKIPSSHRRRRRLSKELETDIDVLYENERGCILCGLPLFSSAALGNLDPSPWTNFVHKSSPTDIRTAQVPDPSWVWAWPEWRINRDVFVDTDKDGWEYSFMFSKKFSWHRPKWWNSFVRRRAWIRRRIKKADLERATDPYVIAAGYFEVTPAKKSHHRSLSRTSSAAERSSSVAGRVSSSSPRRRSPAGRSRTSRDVSRAPSRQSAWDGGDDSDSNMAREELRTIDDLMAVLRRSRIDREKLEAVESYIEHGADDLARLQDYMHEIMAIFVFQASRQLLLARLTHLYDELNAEAAAAEDKAREEEKEQDQENKDKDKDKDKGKSLLSPTTTPEKDGGDDGDDRKEKRKRMRDNLAAAIKHADEEVRRLEYWSDIKDMAEKGESGGAVDPDKGWTAEWQGLDKSGAKGALKDDLP